MSKQHIDKWYPNENYEAPDIEGLVCPMCGCPEHSGFNKHVQNWTCGHTVKLNERFVESDFRESRFYLGEKDEWKNRWKVA